MTIANGNNRNQYVATAGQTSFSYDFKIEANTELKVYQTADGVVADDSADILVLTTDYTVTGVDSATGGNVILNSGATLDDIITIVRNLIIKQPDDYVIGQDHAESLEASLDRMTMRVQMLEDTVSRALNSQQAAATIVTLPLPSADMAIGWDSTGDNLENQIGTVAFDLHIADTSNPHAVNATDVGLANVDNTSDANKPVSTAQQTALDLKYTITDADAKFLHFPDAAAVLIESVANRASKFLGFDAAGEMIYTAGSTTVSANAVGITDAGGYYTGIEVETALQELGLENTVTGIGQIGPTNLSGSSTVDVTGIPSWAKKVVVSIADSTGDGLSTTVVGVELGTSSGIELTGYVSQKTILDSLGVSHTASANMFEIAGGSGAALTDGIYATITLVNISGNTWQCSSVGTTTIRGFSSNISNGIKTLAGVLDRLRVLQTGGSAFTTGTVSIMYEG